MSDNFFQNSLFRMGLVTPITNEFSSQKVVEAYVILDGPNDPNETLQINMKYQQLSLFSEEKDVHYYGWQELKQKEDQEKGI